MAATTALSPFGIASINASPAYDLIDTAAAVSKLADVLDGLPIDPPSIYVDLEGEDLSRSGTISILQLYVLPSKHTYLVDVRTLGDKCFSSPGENGKTLKDILESPSIPKVFFDVRNDSDALFFHFQINLAGVQDLQLMEFATRDFARRFVCGLTKCIDKDAPISPDERLVWKTVKDKGYMLFSPESGGSYEVFNERPLSKDIVQYCIQDVQFLPRLWEHYNQKLTPIWKEKVREASQERVKLSQAADFNGTGRHMALGPSGWTV